MKPEHSFAMFKMMFHVQTILQLKLFMRQCYTNIKKDYLRNPQWKDIQLWLRQWVKRANRVLTKPWKKYITGHRDRLGLKQNLTVQFLQQSSLSTLPSTAHHVLAASNLSRARCIDSRLWRTVKSYFLLTHLFSQVIMKKKTKKIAHNK